VPWKWSNRPAVLVVCSAAGRLSGSERYVGSPSAPAPAA
jgi:hypothetical protein